MKIRLVEEYSTVTGRTWFFVQKKQQFWWWYVSGTMEPNEALARAHWERIKERGISERIRVIDTATI